MSRRPTARCSENSGGIPFIGAFHPKSRPSPLLSVRLFVVAKLRSSSSWVRFFIQTSLEENETAIKKFEQAATKKSYKSACQVFHLKPLH